MYKRNMLISILFIGMVVCVFYALSDPINSWYDKITSSGLYILLFAYFMDYINKNVISKIHIVLHFYLLIWAGYGVIDNIFVYNYTSIFEKFVFTTIDTLTFLFLGYISIILVKNNIILNRGKHEIIS